MPNTNEHDSTPPKSARKSPACHLGPEVELRLERMADAANEAEIRWLIGEWLTEIASVVRATQSQDDAERVAARGVTPQPHYELNDGTCVSCGEPWLCEGYALSLADGTQ